MSNRYAIWNKQDPIITPSGVVFTAEQWIQRHPVAALPNIKIICSKGEINGAYFGTLGQLISSMERLGCDFSECTTEEDILNAVEAFEDADKARHDETAAARQAEETSKAVNLASIAASLEYQNMLTLEDVEEV